MRFLYLGFALFNFLFASIDSNGWVSVEPPKKSSFEGALQEEDSSIWVVFTKKLGPEKLLVRFPEDPEYTYLTPDEMEIFTSQDGATYRLRVLKADPSFLKEREKQLSSDLITEESTTPNTLDLFYRSEGSWVWERLVLTPHHLYILQTTSDTLISEGHQQFVDSLDIQK